MNKLVIHHTYSHGMTFDISNNLNHGIPIGVSAGAGLWTNSFFYRDGNSQMNVRQSPSLTDLGAIRARVRFFHSPTVGGGRRYNLIEGHLTFALFINPDRSLQGTILDSTGNWRGAVSSPGLVAPNVWHQAEFLHDGISQCQILLDGALVAAGFGIPGAVRSVGPHGVAIGHWPEPDPRYTFEGYIGEVHLYKYDPKDDVRQLLDPCCIDRKKLDKVMERLRAEGWNGQKLGSEARNLIQLAIEIAGAVRGTSPVETERHQHNMAESMAAFLRRDAAGMRASFKRSMEQAEQNLSANAIKDYSDRLMSQVDKLPLKPEEFVDIAKSLCWDHAIIRDAHGLKEEMKREQQHQDGTNKEKDVGKSYRPKNK